MALTHESMAGVARRKAQLAREKVRSAEDELVAANEALKAAIPRRDVDAIAQAAERTAHAEGEVREAAHDLEVVDELLDEAAEPRPVAVHSGEGLRSLLALIQRRR
ncbi:MAG TPA: hypothetical protein VFE82_05515 [Ramlibacter sp.]|jgi:hypothetical protein|uniref:hypothetical protein n=1 Tax=Ramlibacter sp. TaxID=1917967 RepID=UPI002D6B209E|nr:hypothetical protein [Ramlibacter sp.]HZY17919.1 hypothetical protein [Ramlibacter sp.]